ncbi:MAG: chitobiase/beta-hexosaminidase C-terminal domain-containing protein [Fibrobacterota bacterium]|nr:MAG: chitobiase/beta-hexosaminidase C-terminal domain-containing protein [Fibrobacterota bacterium]
MNTRICTLLALFALASCREELATEPSTDTPRQFAPRLLAVPNASIVLVEISTQPFGTASGNGILTQREADWNQGSIRIDNLPEGSLWFRVSGLNSDRSRAWSSSGTVPTASGPSIVDIGGSTGVPITTAPALSISATANGDRLQLYCPSTSGSNHHPVWHLGNTSPAPGTNYQSDMKQTTEVDLPANSKITARCTDGTTWGALNTWSWEINPTTPEPDLTSQGTELGAITINAPPVGTAGSVTFSAVTTRMDIPNPQIALRLGGTGSFQRFPMGYSTQVSSATKIEVYQLGWSAVAHRWFKGPLQTGIAGTPELKGAALSFNAPGILEPPSLGGSATFTVPTGTSNLQNLKLAIWTDLNPTWTLQDFSYSLPITAKVTIKAYAIGWNPTSQEWFYGRESTLVISGQSSSTPVVSGPFNEIPQPIATLPPTGSGSVSFAPPTTIPADLYPLKLAVKNSMGGWDWKEMNYLLPVNPGTTFDVYLIGWSNSEKRWKQGSLLTTTVSTFTPPNPPTISAAGYDFSPPGINAFGTFPVNASFSVPADLPAGFTNRQIAYRTAALGTMPSGPFNYTSETSTVPVTSQLQLEACIVAWDPGNSTWKIGQSKTIVVSGGKPVGDPDYTTPGGLDLEVPTLTLPTRLPGNLQVGVPANMPTDLVEAKVAYQLGSTGIWLPARPNENIAIQTPVQVKVYVAAWSNSQQRWMYGRVKTFYLDPAGSTLAPPSFTDLSNNPLEASLEVPGTSFTINLRSTTGSVYYTTDGTSPSPGMGSTQPWSSGMTLQIPTGSDSIVVRAIAYDGSRVSTENKLVVHLPRWTLLDDRDLICLAAGPDGSVFACGDGNGPKRLVDTGWVDLVPNWNLPGAQTLHINDSELVAGVEGQVWRIRKFATCWIYGVTRHGGNLWASTDFGTYTCVEGIWGQWTTVQKPDGTGPMWSDGSNLWQGSGDVLAKYGWDASIPGYNWMAWGTKASNIRAFAADSFSTTVPTLREDMIVATESGIYLWNTTTSSMILRSVVQSDVSGIEGIAWGPSKRLYMAFRDANGYGGVRRTPGWASTWNHVAMGWPGQAEGTPYGATGVGFHRMFNGDTRVVATTPRGTYTVKLLY